MTTQDRLNAIRRRVLDQMEHVQTEQGTRNALINPFIRDVLGFDTEDVRDVRPEFTADIGDKKGEKVDYAIMVAGEPVILVEAKRVGTSLDTERPNQLLRYFGTVKTARYGIFTDGVRYFFYSDLESDNVMDSRPFLALDLHEEIQPKTALAIEKFSKEAFDPDEIRGRARQMMYTSQIKRKLQQLLDDPSEALVRLLMDDVYEGRKTQDRINEFTAFVKSAAEDVFEDKLDDRWNAVRRRDDSVMVETSEPAVESLEDDANDIVTTEDEIAAYHSVKAILYDVVDPSRVIMRDRKTVCLILLDDNARKTVCRLYFTDNRLRIAIPDENGTDQAQTLDRVADIVQHSDMIRDAARRFA